MAYWIHENGETIGPLRAIEVLDRAHPETFVSHGNEWVRLSQHPDFARVAEALPTDMPSEPQISPAQPGSIPNIGADRSTVESNGNPEDRYWIYENSKTVGPLSRAEIRSVARPKTLVSRGQSWLPFIQHPDFRSGGGSNPLSTGRPAADGEDLDELEARGRFKTESVDCLDGQAHQQESVCLQEERLPWINHEEGESPGDWDTLVFTRILGVASVLALISVLIIAVNSRTGSERELSGASSQSVRSTEASVVSTQPTPLGPTSAQPLPQPEKNHMITLGSALREYDSPLAKYESLFDTSKYGGEWVLHDSSWRAQAQIAARQIVDAGRSVRQACGDNDNALNTVLREMTEHYDNVGGATFQLLESRDTAYLKIIESEIELGWMKSRETIAIIRTNQQSIQGFLAKHDIRLNLTPEQAREIYGSSAVKSEGWGNRVKEGDPITIKFTKHLPHQRVRSFEKLIYSDRVNRSLEEVIELRDQFVRDYPFFWSGGVNKDPPRVFALYERPFEFDGLNLEHARVSVEFRRWWTGVSEIVLHIYDETEGEYLKQQRSIETEKNREKARGAW